MNKKELYESIMLSVSKEIKKALNESSEEKTDVEKAADILEQDLKKAKFSIDFAIDFMKIVSRGHESKTFYKNVSYKELLPELEKRKKERE